MARRAAEVQVAGDKKTSGDKSRGGLVGDAKDVVTTLRAYAEQETIGPLKGVGRYLAFGLAGTVMLSIGTLLLVLAGLRALQTETSTWFTGNLSWIPYFIMMIAAGAVIALSVRAVTRDAGGEA